MSRFLDFLRRILHIKSPSRHMIDQYRAYTPPIMPVKIPMPQVKPFRPDGMTITTTSNPYSDYPNTYEEAKAMWEKIDAQAVEDYHEFLKKNVNLPQSDPDGLGLAWGGCSIFDEIHENTRLPATLYANDKPVITIRADGIDAFCAALRKITAAAAEAAAALGAMARAVTDADLINRYSTAKEIHYITHARKARTRKKYRNRVLRRARRTERRNARESRTPRA